jgi:pimeloyl-ACP methyl ester carboxylesterase
VTIKGRSATAGLRGAHWNPARLPEGMSLSSHSLSTADGAVTSGFLFSTGGERLVVCLMHPREVLASHYLVPDILKAGAAVWVQAPRSPGNDIRLEHEIALLDVAAGLVFLRQAGFEKIVLLGNSGGAGLYALYNQQANAAPGDRLATTPAGRPTGLSTAELPVPDGLILVSPHPGQGRLLMNALDPSVVNENDPRSVEPMLDPFSEQNGYQPYPSDTCYSPEFLVRYRAAQTLRVARIDRTARAIVERRTAARRKLKAGATRIDAAHSPLITVWRTDADLRCFDLTLDPSDRRFGSLWGADPFVSNWGSIGFARICTAESWLSTWSGLSSRAAVEPCAPAIGQPSLLIQYTGDNCVFPADIALIFAAIGSSDKVLEAIPGDHHGRRLSPDGIDGQLMAGETIRNWLGETFGAFLPAAARTS